MEARSAWIDQQVDSTIERFGVSRKIDEWESTLSTESVAVMCAKFPTGDFTYGALARVSLADITCGFIDADVHQAVRTRSMTRSINQGFYKFGVQRSGTSKLVQDDRVVDLIPGDIAFYDTSRPHKFIADSPMTMMVYTIPRYAFRDDPKVMSEFTAVQLGGSNGLGSLASSFMLSLPTKLDHSGMLLRTHLADTLVSLVAAVIVELQGREHLEAKSAPELLRLVVQDTIRREVKNPELSPEWLAKRHSVSLRYLYRAFEGAEHSVTQHIRRLRLEHCKTDLRRMEYRELSISNIASKWGFVEAAHFSRVFKKEFGLTPREYRQAAREQSSDSREHIESVTRVETNA